MIEGLNRDVRRIVSEVQQCVVQVTNGRRGAGAGVIWRAEGLIVTNAHVVAERGRRGWRRPAADKTFTVTLADGRSFPAQVTAVDMEHDLAALAIAAVDLPTIPPGDARRLQAGQWVIAIGHPWGVTGAASAGHVIDVGAPLEWNGSGNEMVQVGIQLRPGHSGGPLVDANGRLVGINTMITGPQVGLAIPVHTVLAFLTQVPGSHVHPVT